MANKKLTETSVSRMAGECLRDTELIGFQVRKRASGKFFYFQYRSPLTHKQRRYAIGMHGTLTVEQARDGAKLLSGKVALGLDPLEEKQAIIVSEEKKKKSTLRAFMSNEYREVTPKKTADPAVRSIELHFQSWLDQPMSKISAWDVEKWKQAYKGKPSGANRILSSLRGVLSKAVKSGLLDKSPMPNVKQLKEDKNKKVRYLSKEEEGRLFKALDDRQDKQRAARNRYILWCEERGMEAPQSLSGEYTDHLKPMVILSLNTGLRLGEAFNLSVDDLDLISRVLVVEGEGSGERTGAKSGQSRLVPLNDKAFSMLTSWLNQTKNKDLVFPSPKTGKRFHIDGIKTAWTSVRKSSGLLSFRFHDLRHTFGTRLAHKLTDLVTIKELMGHESLDTTARYLHTSNELKTKAVMAL